MKVKALRIEINGKEVAVAGAEGLGVLTGYVGFGAESAGSLNLGTIVFSVMGLDIGAVQPRQLTWAEGVRLSLGDRVTFELVETDNPSPPSNVRASPSPAELSAAASAEKKPHAKSRK